MSLHSAGKGKIACSRYAILPFFCPFGIWRLCTLPVFLLLFLMIPQAHAAGAETSSALPVISRLDSRDTVFMQYLQDVEASRRSLFPFRRELPDRTAAEQIASSLTVYAYTLRQEDDLLGIAARCNVPYATLASLNRLSHTEDLSKGKSLLLPSIPGIFIPEKPATDLEHLLSAARPDTGSEDGKYDGVLLSIPLNGKTERFRFIPGDDFSPTERIFFLNRGFHFPLQSFKVTSLYGPRINPVTGKPSMHGGIDLAAPEGSEVHAARDGTVMDLGQDPILGKYIIIRHDNNWISIYGHLSAISTALHAEVQSGSVIGRVGSTGQSTGPHLHFEIKQNGQSRDPAGLLGLFRGTTGQ